LQDQKKLILENDGSWLPQDAVAATNGTLATGYGKSHRNLMDSDRR